MGKHITTYIFCSYFWFAATSVICAQNGPNLRLRINPSCHNSDISSSTWLQYSTEDPPERVTGLNFTLNNVAYQTATVSFGQSFIQLEASTGNELLVFPIVVPLSSRDDMNANVYFKHSSDTLAICYRNVQLDPNFSRFVFGDTFNESLSFCYGIDLQEGSIFLRLDSLDFADHPLWTPAGPLLVGPEPYFGTPANDTTYIPTGLILQSFTDDWVHVLTEMPQSSEFSLQSSYAPLHSLQTSNLQNLCFNITERSSSSFEFERRQGLCVQKLSEYLTTPDDRRGFEVDLFDRLGRSLDLPANLKQAVQRSNAHVSWSKLLIIDDQCLFKIP